VINFFNAQSGGAVKFGRPQLRGHAQDSAKHS
jgi:hypothetical protein